MVQSESQSISVATSTSPIHTTIAFALIAPDGQVSTVAGKGTPGYADGDRNTALFDTPCGIVVRK